MESIGEGRDNYPAISFLYMSYSLYTSLHAPANTVHFLRLRVRGRHCLNVLLAAGSQ